MTAGTNRRRIELPAEDGQLDTVDIGNITLESGDILPDVTIALQRWGALSPPATTSYSSSTP